MYEMEAIKHGNTTINDILRINLDIDETTTRETSCVTKIMKRAILNITRKDKIRNKNMRQYWKKSRIKWVHNFQDRMWYRRKMKAICLQWYKGWSCYEFDIKSIFSCTCTRLKPIAMFQIIFCVMSRIYWKIIWQRLRNHYGLVTKLLFISNPNSLTFWK